MSDPQTILCQIILAMHPRHGLMVLVLRPRVEVDLEQIGRSRAVQAALAPRQPFGWQN